MVKNLVIPKAVADEISTYSQGRSGFIDLKQETWIGVQSITAEQRATLLLPKLDRGEAEVIALALEREARLVLIKSCKIAQSRCFRFCGDFNSSKVSQNLLYCISLDWCVQS